MVQTTETHKSNYYWRSDTGVASTREARNCKRTQRWESPGSHARQSKLKLLKAYLKRQTFTDTNTDTRTGTGTGTGTSTSTGTDRDRDSDIDIDIDIDIDMDTDVDTDVDVTIEMEMNSDG